MTRRPGVLAAGRTAALSLALVVVLVPLPAASGDEAVTGDRGTDMLIDLVIMRPIGAVTTVLGAAVLVLSLPLTIPTDTVEDVARELVVKPAEYTFDRPLGDLHRCGADRHPCGVR